MTFLPDLMFFLFSEPSFSFVFAAFIHYSETVSISVFPQKYDIFKHCFSLYKVKGLSGVITVMLLSKGRTH